MLPLPLEHIKELSAVVVAMKLIRSGNTVKGLYEKKMLKKKLKLWRPIKLKDIKW
ncbi:MAG: hypothetical protein J5U19_11240 [Candidatus Methanoperedens sp.]|nr:hypothetical protein [Candidatus Methanoperedens sp.]